MASVADTANQQGDLKESDRPITSDHALGRARGTVAARWLCVLLALLTLAAYWPCLTCDFVTYDDADYVTANPHVRDGLTTSSVSWAFTTFDHANWHPLTWLSLEFNSELFGLAPIGFHLTNLLLHIASAVLLFATLSRLTRSLWCSFAVAVLFALHPLHVESVAWVTERKDVLCAFFWMLGLWTYARRHTGRACKSVGFGVFTCIALSLMAKPMAVTFPFVLVLFDFWPLARFAEWTPANVARSLREKWPLLLLSLASGVVTVIAQHHGGAVRTLETFSFADRIASAANAYLVYIRQMFWPSPLVALWPLVHRTFLQPEVLACLAVLALLSVGAWRLRRSRPHLLFGWLWYLGTLVPVIGLVAVGEQDHADRYTYLPLIGLFVALVWEVRAFVTRLPGLRTPVIATSFAVAAVLAVLTHRQCGVWKNGETLWTHALRYTTPTTTSLFGLGSYYRNSNQPAPAIPLFRKVLEIDPAHQLARSNIAWCLLLTGDIAGADGEFTRILPVPAQSPDFAYQLGRQAMQANRPGLAAGYFVHVLNAQPENAGAHMYLAMALLESRQPAAALKSFDDAQRLNPAFKTTASFQEAVAAAKALVE